MTDPRKGHRLPWSPTVNDDNYGDAYDFLSLRWLPAVAGRAVQTLRDAEFARFRPGDLLRAAGLEPLPLTDTGVRMEIAKAFEDGQFQPPLCINLPQGVVIADGYHRLSAAYHLDPLHKVPLKLAPTPRDAFQA